MEKLRLLKIKRKISRLNKKIKKINAKINSLKKDKHDVQVSIDIQNIRK